MMNPIIRNENSPLEELMESALHEANIKFKAQYTVYDGNKDNWNAKYILDFLVYGQFCKIAVECDGNTYHGSSEARERDLRRDLWVKQLAFDDTLRFNTEQIKYNLDGCIKQINNMIHAYDKIKYDKEKKFVFDITKIPTCVPKQDAEYIYKDLSKVIQHVCNNAHMKIKITNRKKPFIVNALRKSIFESGYAEINNTFAYFDSPQLENYKNHIDIFFGAYNIPCFIIVASRMQEVKFPKELANDPTILKIIILFVTPSKLFKGKSFIILNGTTSNNNKVIYSDLVDYYEQNFDAIQCDELIKEAEKLERKLKKVYKRLYTLNHFRISLLSKPFSTIEKVMYEKILISIEQFLLSKDTYLNEETEAMDIAVEWIKREGIYFKNVPYTLHDVALTIQHFRNKIVN
ncbi:DUF559 domain-containing protein [Lysinibacillus sp. FSL L8-0312]|uniref:endonuclease domain-containing protein n=1 Tax=Lysinibacillus sp. FSL L8-0312 TaxID=2921521 RepID=UPI0030FC314A